MTRRARLPLLPVALGAAAILTMTATPAIAGPRINATDIATAESAVTAYFAATAPLWNTTPTANAHSAQRALVKSAAAPQATAASSAVDSTDVWIGTIQATITDAGLSITDTTVTTVVTSDAVAQGEVTSYSDVTTDWTLVDTDGTTSDASATVEHETVSIYKTVVEDTVLPEPSEVPAADDDPQIVETDTPSSDDPTTVTDPPKDVPNPTASQASGARTAAGVQPMFTRFPRLNYSGMAKYALLWTDAAHASKEDPNYPTQSDMCASFASQALHVGGGWPIEQGISRTALINWSPDLTGPYHQSYTWSRSGELHDRIITLGGGTRLSNIWGAGVGDLLMVDWNAGGGTIDGKLDHTMIVTGLTKSWKPRISQKTNNRHNIPLSTEIAIAKSGSQPATVIHWYGIRT